MRIAIACGGTGGHFFPGLAVGAECGRRGAEVMLIASKKSVDQESAQGEFEAEVRFLPAVGWMRGRRVGFVLGLIRSLLQCGLWFREWRPHRVLVMGGFTSLAPALMGRCFGARVYLHEANAIPGRANRLLSRICHRLYVGFPVARSAFPGAEVFATGTPVREEFGQPLGANHAEALGLRPEAPILLVMGGSQGARAINELMLEVAPLLSARHPSLQYIHLTGRQSSIELKVMYQRIGARFHLAEFARESSILVRLATAVLSRAGASSVSEYAVSGLPGLLIPYPSAVDDHQRFNAEAFVRDGAALMLSQSEAVPEQVAQRLESLLFDQSTRISMKAALGRWSSANAASRIVDDLLGSPESETVSGGESSQPGTPKGSGGRRENSRWDFEGWQTQI